MTTGSTQQAIVLRDSEGNFYLISEETLQAGRVPAEKAEQLQQALSSDVSGFLANVFSPNFAAVLQGQAQTNNISGNNVLLGGFAIGNVQGLTQTGVNLGGQQANVTQL